MDVGPLVRLQWWGLLFRCLEKEDDHSARIALQHVQNRRIRWHPSNQSNNNKSWQSWFHASSKQQATDQAPVVATLTVRDDATGRPEVWVQSNTTTHSVRLRRIHRVETDPSTGIVTLSAAPVDRQQQQPPKVLLQFVLLVASSSDSSPPKDSTTTSPDGSSPVVEETVLPSDERNAFVHHLQVLLEWDKQRRLNHPEEDDDDDEDENQPNFLQAKAQQAAHFAQRELELRETRKNREARKAALVQQAGGLKYTALAMANANS